MKGFLLNYLSKQKIKNTSYEEQLYKESLKSEIYRIYILIAIICLLILYLITLSVFYSNENNYTFEENSIFVFGIIILGVLLFREIIVKNFLLKRINEGKNIPSYWQYANSFIEVSFPTVAVIVFAQYTSPIYALFTPVSLTYFIFIILSTLELDEKLCLFVSFVSSVQLSLVSYFYLAGVSVPHEIDVLKNPVVYIGKSLLLILSGFLAAFVTYQIKKRIIGSFQILDERNRIEQLFGQQVSKAVVSELIKSHRDKIGIKKEVCIMFLDVRDYSKYAFGKEPEEIIKYQNNLFSFMIDIVLKNNGIINQIMGDGFMASFGAPISYENDCLDAVKAALEILRQLEVKNKNNEIPFTRVGIGIHTGEAVTGNVGNSTRKQFSISGNVVIIASRIEQLNKEFNSALLISRQVYQKVKSEINSAHDLGETEIKGSSEPIGILRLS